ncbi:MAG TPA: hypothetical protein VI913_02200 [Candidatus Peribacteraceae bacterium]|nr:hypothetical protein [Candidatus Peribacteraceae bacterium]
MSIISSIRSEHSAFMPVAQEEPRQEPLDRGTLLTQARELRSGAISFRKKLEALGDSGIQIDPQWIQAVNHVLHIDPRLYKADVAALHMRLERIKKSFSGYLIELAQQLVSSDNSEEKKSHILGAFESAAGTEALRPSVSVALQRLFREADWRQSALHSLKNIDPTSAVVAMDKERQETIDAQTATQRAKIDAQLPSPVSPVLYPGIRT